MSAARSAAWSRGRVTTMPRPARGLFANRRKNFRGAAAAKLGGGARAERFGLRGGAFAVGARDTLAVGRCHERAQAQPVIGYFRKRAQRNGAAPAERQAHRALGPYASRARRIRER